MAENTPTQSDAGDQQPAKKAAAKKAAGTKLTRGKETVTAYKASTVTQLKSQGWKVK